MEEGKDTNITQMEENDYVCSNEEVNEPVEMVYEGILKARTQPVIMKDQERKEL